MKKDKTEYSIDFCQYVANISNEYEKQNTDIKREFIIKNIQEINEIMKRIKGYCGSFGTGYPFYALDKDLNGILPIIEEQFRYNNCLIDSANSSNLTHWLCAYCLNEKGNTMPDLKVYCKPCPAIDDELKPRKIINRLPDIDMWIICKEEKIEDAKIELLELLNKNNMYPSDIDPLKSIRDVVLIVNDLKNGVMPSKHLPIDIHIISYEELYSLIEQLPHELKTSKKFNKIPFLPIHPYSLRKKWQKDDESYNFVLDFLYSLTDYNWEPKIKIALIKARKQILKNFKEEELKKIVDSTSPVVSRRMKTPVLEKKFKGRIDSWKEK